MTEQPSSRIIVEAIDDGRIVRVTEEYARREGLPILRKREVSFVDNPSRKAAIEQEKKEIRGADAMNTFRRPLRSKQGDSILSTLKENFHWDIAQKRKQMNLTRKQLADRLGVKELDIKMIENGVLPSQDYVLITKLEQLYGISLRKDGVLFAKASELATAAVSKAASSKSQSFSKPQEKPADDRNVHKREAPLSGDDIEIEY